jgi:hypothetical protein
MKEHILTALSYIAIGFLTGLGAMLGMMLIARLL